MCHTQTTLDAWQSEKFIAFDLYICLAPNSAGIAIHFKELVT